MSLDSPFGHCLGRISVFFSLLREWASVVMPLTQFVLLDEYVDGWGICELPNVSWAVLCRGWVRDSLSVLILCSFFLPKLVSSWGLSQSSCSLMVDLGLEIKFCGRMGLFFPAWCWRDMVSLDTCYHLMSWYADITWLCPLTKVFATLWKGDILSGWVV